MTVVDVCVHAEEALEDVLHALDEVWGEGHACKDSNNVLDEAHLRWQPRQSEAMAGANRSIAAYECTRTSTVGVQRCEQCEYKVGLSRRMQMQQGVGIAGVHQWWTCDKSGQVSRVAMTKRGKIQGRA